MSIIAFQEIESNNGSAHATEIQPVLKLSVVVLQNGTPVEVLKHILPIGQYTYVFGSQGYILKAQLLLLVLLNCAQGELPSHDVLQASHQEVFPILNQSVLKVSQAVLFPIVK